MVNTRPNPLMKGDSQNDSSSCGRFPTSLMTFSNYLSLRTGFRANRPYRSEAIRRLVELGTEGEDGNEACQQTRPEVARAELATKAIEKLIDPSAPAEERAQRKRQLTKGPPEFRENRVDLPKAKGK
jgi:hypothetical protein